MPHAVDCLHAGSPSLLEANRALHVLDIMEKAALSAKSGLAMDL